MNSSILTNSMSLFRTRIAAALVLCSAVLVFGTVGYVLIENYSLVDGLYMSMITISTVGFGEVTPLSTTGRLFTTGLILFGFLAFAFAGHAIGQSLLERVWTGQTERKKMQKKIDGLRNHYIVCGYGRVGAAAVAHFEKLSSEFVIIESHERQLALLKEKGYCHLNGDATHEEVLDQAGIKHAKGLLSLLDEDPDNLFVVLSAREMNPTLNIISRSNEISSGPKIIRAGADDVISLFDSAGRQIASEILHATGQLEQSSASKGTGEFSPCWIPVEAGSSMVGRTIDNLSCEMQRTVVGLRRKSEDILMPDGTIELTEGDQVLVPEEYSEFDTGGLDVCAKPNRVAIVDDNPVIVKLYARLFQKAGFIPIAATNGRDGLNVILKEKPHAAIIDYNLPAMSGIDVCRNIRRKMDSECIKLILFTADESRRTRQAALDSGADAVVIKSAEASEIIQTVKHFL